MIVRASCAPNYIGDNTWFCLATVADAKPITEAEKKHCASAYHKYCGEYGLESAALRNCMSRIGRSLSDACVDALIDAGESHELRSSEGKRVDARAAHLSIRRVHQKELCGATAKNSVGC